MTFLPIVERELRTAARRRATYWLRTFAALSAIIVALLTMADASFSRSPAFVAKQTFATMSGLLMVFCLLTGTFLTADCLSSEKREGTLGLLFLTDLRGYDVVLGKLVASSVPAGYGLLSVLPILSIPMLAGGVTLGEFWRVVLVLLAGMFFSLGVGMFVSALSRDTRQAMGISALLVVIIAGLLPAIYELLALIFKVRATVPLLWPSLGYTLGRAYDAYYSYGTGATEYWGSMLTIAGMGLAGLFIATLILPRAWQEKTEPSVAGKGGSKWRRMRYGAARRRQAIRRLLAGNPFHWLAVRDRLPRVSFWIVAGIAAPFWLIFLGMMFLMSSPFAWLEPFQILIFATCILGLLLKCLVAAEASRRLNDDRKSGALELLLVTPLSEKQIITGQRRGLRDQFFVPVGLMVMLFAMLWLAFAIRTANSNNFRDDGVTAVMMVGNMVVLLTDFNALSLVGMWMGLRSRYHHRAVLGTLLRILVVPWVMFFMLKAFGFFNSNRPTMFFIAWFTLCAIYDVIWARVAGERLKREFRQVASGVGGKNRRRVTPAFTEQAGA